MRAGASSRLTTETGACGRAARHLPLPSRSGGWGSGPFSALRSLPRGSRDSASLLSPPTRRCTDSQLPGPSRPVLTAALRWPHVGCVGGSGRVPPASRSSSQPPQGESASPSPLEGVKDACQHPWRGSRQGATGSDSCRSAWGALRTSPSSRGVPCGVRNSFLARSPPQKRAAVLSASWCRGSVV